MQADVNLVGGGDGHPGLGEQVNNDDVEDALEGLHDVEENSQADEENPRVDVNDVVIEARAPGTIPIGDQSI